MPVELDVRDLIMNVEEAQTALQYIKTNYGNMDTSLASMKDNIDIGLRDSWKGQSALDFFFMFDRVIDGLQIQLRMLSETYKKFDREIGEWIKMAETLEP